MRHQQGDTDDENGNKRQKSGKAGAEGGRMKDEGGRMKAAGEAAGPETIDLVTLGEALEFLDEVVGDGTVELPSGSNLATFIDNIGDKTDRAKLLIAVLPIAGRVYERQKAARRADAAGWIKKLYWQPGLGLKGLVEWTAEAREAIRGNRYGYLSPVLLVHKADNRAVELHSAALTNVPAIPRMERLAASTRQENAMPENPTNGNIETPDAKLQKILGILRDRGIEVANVSREGILDAVIAYLEGNAPGEDAEVASSVRDILRLEPDSGKDEVILAMTTRDTGGADAELAAMREAQAERVAKEQVDRYVKENKINPHDQNAMAAALSLAREHPDRFQAIMAGTVSNPPPGRTTPPDSRSRLMMLAAREYRGDEALKNTTSCEAFIDLKIRDGGFSPLTSDEAREFAKVV